MDCCQIYYRKINYKYCPECAKNINLEEKDRLKLYFLNKNIGKIYYYGYSLNYDGEYGRSPDIKIKTKILDDLKNLSKFYVIEIIKINEINEYKEGQYEIKSIIVEDFHIYEENEYLDKINNEFKYFTEWYNSYWGKINIDKKLYVVCKRYNWYFREYALGKNESKKLGKFKKEYIEEYAKKKLKLDID